MDIRKIIPIVIFILIITGLFTFAETQLELTQGEKDYIVKAGVIKAISVDGLGPIQYTDTNGEVQGISRQVLEEISDMTGLTFQYKLYNSSREAYADADADIFFGVPYHYASVGMTLSQPFLKTETILYINSSTDSNQLDDKIYAAVEGRVFAEGIKEENTIYFNTREESLNAVEKGKADYGYGNIYSVAFYTVQNNYKNVVMVPKGRELREYRMGFPKNDRILLSIINKAIDAIDDGKMETLILDATTRIDRKSTLSMMVDVYDKKTFGIILLIIVILLFSVISSIRLNNKFRIQNKINDMLSQISNEYLYKYFVKSDHLDLSKKYTQLFRTQEQLDKVRSILRDTLLDNNLDGNIPMIKLPVIDGVTRTFKAVSLNIHDKKRKSDLVIGKLIDISEQIAEKKELIMKTKIDGLTSLYNAATVKELINESIKSRDKHQIDALIIMDCDKFKYINDTYGHLTGDQVLKNVSMGLRLTFRQNDILGRVGGDEFCVYMRNVFSADLVQSKCQQLNEIIQEINRGFYISVSSGIAFLREESTYRELFAKADKALYEAKKKGGGQCVIYSERQRMFHKGNLIWAGANYEKKG